MIDNNDIEKRLASAINAAAPDMLDDLMTELDLTEKPEPVMREKLAGGSEERYKKSTVRSRGFRQLMSIAAALVLVLGGVTVWRNMQQKVFAVVDIDVNPSIELSINKNDKVVEARPVNEDGMAILSGMDLKGSEVKAACNAIVGSMLMKGYINDQSNSLLVSVSAEDEAKGHEIEAQLSDSINMYMDDSAVATAILGQYVANDDELRAFAENNGISFGKAWLIRRLLESGNSKMTEESLLALTTQELIVLSQERNVDSVSMRGTAYTGKYVGYDAALDAAVAQAGADKSQISNADVEMDCENGIIIYEVEFDYAGTEYEYEVDAATGNIVTTGSGADIDDDDDDDDRYDIDDDDDDDDRYDADDDDADDDYRSTGKSKKSDIDDDDDDDDDYDDDADDRHERKKSGSKKSSRSHDDDDEDDEDDDD